MSRLRISLGKLEDYSDKLRRLLIDGDILVYTLGFAVEDKIEWPDGTTEISGDLRLAKRLLDNRIRYFTSSCPTSIAYSMVITGDAPCWRKTLDASYKAGRGRKPVDYAGLRAYMKSLPMVYTTVDGLEADDYLAQEASKDPYSCAIMSFDKDFFTVPGTFIHLTQNSKPRIYSITPTQAISFLFFQALAGDRVDSYNGVDYIGTSKAAKLLQLCELKGLTIRQAYLLLKQCVTKRSKQFAKTKALNGANLWHQFRGCLDLAALTWHEEKPCRGIGLRRVFKYRAQGFEYFLPYYDPEHTHKHTRFRL